MSLSSCPGHVQRTLNPDSDRPAQPCITVVPPPHWLHTLPCFQYAQLRRGLIRKSVQCSLQAAEDPKKKVKQIKDVWAALKPLKITPEDHTLGPEERQLVEDILSGSRHVHEKQLQGFQALWAVLNRFCPFTVYKPTA